MFLSALEEINRTFERINRGSKRIKLLKTIEKHTGIEPGTSVVIITSIVFSLVLFTSWNRFIYEAHRFIYPSYMTLRFPDKYWYTYWLFNAMQTLLTMVLPTISIIYAILFLFNLYMVSPDTLSSYEIHSYLSKTIYSKLKNT